MKKTVLMYWPIGGNVETSAKIFNKIDNTIILKPIREVEQKDFEAADRIIIGSSTVGEETWGEEKANSPWADFFKVLNSIDWTGKKVAIFGLGDQVRWPRHFVDGMAVIHEKLNTLGANVQGEWPIEGYDFEESEAQKGDHFVGLALDEDNEPELSEERIKAWLKTLQ